MIGGGVNNGLVGRMRGVGGIISVTRDRRRFSVCRMLVMKFNLGSYCFFAVKAMCLDPFI
jgi:hypothetical protein